MKPENFKIKKEDTIGKQKEKDCYVERDAECNKFISNLIATGLASESSWNLGSLSSALDKYKNGIYASSVANWGTINKGEVFADMNIVTLLRTCGPTTTSR